MPTQPPHRSAPLHPVPATVCGLVAIGLLFLLPSAAAADPTLGPVPSPADAGWWTVAAVLVLQALVVAWVGRFPATALPGLAALPFVLVWAAPGVAFSLTVVAQLTGVFLAVVARPPRRRLWGALGATALLLATGQFLNEARSGGTDTVIAVTGALLQTVVVVGLPLLLGLVIAAQRDAHDARYQEVRALRREQDALLQAAVSRQRVAMSRELHDIAAHHMSGIALMAAAMDRQIDSDPVTAKGSARQIREQSSAVLDDLRRLVGLLREEADAARPVETLDAVAALVDTRRAAGAEIDLVVPEGDTGPGAGVGPLAHLVAYRMVQESLANAAAHAPGARCAVEIDDLHDRRLTITVRNGASTGPDPGPGGGFGLIGMAERAQLVGADLTYGATPDGGWEVRLTLPVDDTISRTRAPAPLTEDTA
ncbi:sensor histidine kinase [Pseudonocardia parietis]|uniref:histidine kinase n=1 Tax=Pseudonocardia parietis TaxID=570936 RepID=A0ABS4VKI5_9PSEU|nr:histidine kinase [Pseudonocardia parietis]MBP2364429.1 signal transduction histidine kinase [Pseudonocardia parietis]